MEFAKDNVCKSHGTYAWYRSAKDYYHITVIVIQVFGKKLKKNE